VGEVSAVKMVNAMRMRQRSRASRFSREKSFRKKFIGGLDTAAVE
jgi:hypothetical protein